MTFRNFSKNLAQEIEKVVANIGEIKLPDQTHRPVDQPPAGGACENVDISKILERMKDMGRQETN